MIDRDPWDPPVPFCGCKGHHTPGACPVEPYSFGQAPMGLEEYDAIRDAVTAARFDDKALLPEALDAALAGLGVLAMTGTGSDSQAAAQVLRRICQRAVTGVPMYEPQEEVL